MKKTGKISIKESKLVNDRVDISSLVSGFRLPKIVREKLQFLKQPKNLYFFMGVLGFAVVAILLSKYLVVAWVDNKPITRFELYSNLEKRFGKDTREQLIVEKLIVSEAIKRNVVVSEDDINTEIKKIEQLQGGSEQLSQLLKLQSISQSEFKYLVKLQIIRQKVFGQNVNISDEDVKKYVDENKESLSLQGVSSDNVTGEAQLKIKEELKQAKVNEEFNKWLEETLKSPRIKRAFLTYLLG